MHIITGLIIVSLLGKKNDHGKPAHLSFHGVIELVHYLPGRMRYRIPSLVGEEKMAKNIQTQMKRLTGVKDVQIQPLTGGVLIQFEPESINPDLVYSVLVRLAGLDKQVERTPPSLVGTEIGNFGRFCNHLVYEKSSGLLDLKTVFPLAMFTYGIQRMITQGMGMPSGFTLVWWGYQTLRQQGGEQDS